MIHRIRKGKHRCWPVKIGLTKRDFHKWKVRFNLSCVYNTGNDDINKLCGFGYLWNMHEESARFGWRWNTTKGCIELFSYCYIRGMRVSHFMADLEINNLYEISLTKLENSYRFIALGVTYFEQGVNHKKKWKYPANFFFGGDSPAPHLVKVEIEKV